MLSLPSEDNEEQVVTPAQRPIYQMIRTEYLHNNILPPEQLVEQYQEEYGEDLPINLVKLYNRIAAGHRSLPGNSDQSSPRPYRYVFSDSDIESEQPPKVDNGKGRADKDQDKDKGKGKADKDQEKEKSSSVPAAQPDTSSQPPSKRPLYRTIRTTYLAQGKLPPSTLVNTYHTQYQENLPLALEELYNNCAKALREAKGTHCRAPKSYQRVFGVESTQKITKQKAIKITKEVQPSLAGKKKGKHSTPESEQEPKLAPAPAPAEEDSDLLAKAYRESLSFDPDEGLAYMRGWYSQEQLRLTKDAQGREKASQKSGSCTIQ